MAVEGMNTEYWLSEARLLEPYDLGPLLFNFILSNIVALGTGVSFSRFSGEREKGQKSAKLGWRTNCARLALHA